MTEYSGPRPLPTHEEYAAGAESIQRYMSDKGLTAKEYLNQLPFQTESARNFSTQASGIGRAIEPVDEYTLECTDPSLKRQRAYYLGSLAGFVVLKEVYGPTFYGSQVFEHLPQQALEFKEDDHAHNIIAMYEALSSTGRIGSRLMGRAAMERIHLWGEQSVFNADYRETFNVAAGVVVVAASEMQRKRIATFHREQIEELVDSADTLDWDAALRSLAEDR